MKIWQSYNFDQNGYKLPGANSDKRVAKFKNENTKSLERFKRSWNNLEDVIKYEEVAQYTDT